MLVANVEMSLNYSCYKYLKFLQGFMSQCKPISYLNFILKKCRTHLEDFRKKYNYASVENSFLTNASLFEVYAADNTEDTLNFSDHSPVMCV